MSSLLQRTVLLFAILFSPLVAFAAVGFAQESVWLSHTPVLEGETVSIYAALTNGGTTVLTSTAYFRDNGTLVGSLPVSLTPGEARIVSIPWTPHEGKHALAVELASSSVELARGTETASVTVEKRTPLQDMLNLTGGKSAAAATAFSDSSGIQQKIEDLSPAVSGVVNPVFKTLDSWRLSGATFLENQSKSVTQKASAAGKEKEALAANNSSDKNKSRILTFTQILYTILSYIYNAIQTLLAKAALFFPILALLFFYVLWKLYRRFKRPSYSY